MADRLDAFLNVQSDTAERALAAALSDGGIAAQLPPEPSGVIAHTILQAVRSGRRVHVFSLDQSAADIGTRLEPVFARFGVSVGRITASASMRERAASYARDVVFLSVQEAVMDVLRLRSRGRSGLSALRRGFARIGSADPVALFPLPAEIDLALVIDGDDTLIARSMAGIVLTDSKASGSVSQLMADDVMSVASQFRANDFVIVGQEVRLTAAGRNRLSLVLPGLGATWGNPARASMIVTRALQALHLWQEGADFAIREGAIKLSDALERFTSDEPGLDACTLLERRFRLESSQGVARPTLERIPIRAVMRDFGSLSVLMKDPRRHAVELRRDYGLKLHKPVRPLPRSELCLHPKLLRELLPAEPAVVFLAGGTPREVEWLREQAELPEVALAPSAERPEMTGTAVVVSQSGDVWPKWARQSDVKRISLLPYSQEDEEPPTAVLRWLQRNRGLKYFRVMVFRWLEKRRIDANAVLRQRLYDFDRSCRKTVSMLGDKDA